MDWTKEAEQQLAEIPDFIRDKARKRVNDEAVRQKIARVDAAFLKKFKGQHNSKLDPPRVSEHPLAEAFSRKYAVHAGMMGGEQLKGDKEALLRQEIAHSDPANPAMAYLHIPFCSSRCLFCGFYAEASVPAIMKDYARNLAAEIRLIAPALQQADQQLQAIYFGGGTPTDLSADSLGLLLETIRTELPLADDCEITIEGRIFDFDDEKIKQVLDCGANRFSLGVQSFDTRIRRQVGRIHSREELIERLNRLIELADPYAAAVIIDLIFGLPGQTEVEWLSDIDCAITETGIHGLDLYQINMIPGTPLFVGKDKLPRMANLEERGQLFSAGCKRMAAAGFERLSIAHWRRSERERNRYNSWNKTGINCLPLGCGAGGRWGAVRLFQENDLNRYTESIKAGRKPLTTAIKAPAHHLVVAAAVGQLEQQQLDINALEQIADTPLPQLLPMLQQWQEAGLLNLSQNNRAQLTEAGEFWVVNLQQLIDVKLKEILCAT